MIINQPAMDYWRATTDHIEYLDEMMDELIGQGEIGEKWFFQQYKGHMFGSVKAGTAIQNGRPSYIIDVSGETAHTSRNVLKYSDMKVTRLDVQYTIRKPSWWDTVEYHYMMEMGEWPNNVTRHVNTLLNRGDDTVRIGSRTSETFIRVYVKESDYVRFEVEYKKSTAVASWKLIKAGDVGAMASMLIAEIDAIPYHPLNGEIRKSLVKMTDYSFRPRPERVTKQPAKKLRWLASLLPTIEKMANDSEYGHVVRGWILDLAERNVINREMGEQDEND